MRVSTRVWGLLLLGGVDSGCGRAHEPEAQAEGGAAGAPTVNSGAGEGGLLMQPHGCPVGRLEAADGQHCDEPGVRCLEQQRCGDPSIDTGFDAELICRRNHFWDYSRVTEQCWSCIPNLIEEETPCADYEEGRTCMLIAESGCDPRVNAICRNGAWEPFETLPSPCDQTGDGGAGGMGGAP